MMKSARTAVLVMFVFLLLSSQVMAWVQYKDGGIHDISTIIDDDISLDWEVPNVATTVNVLDGASIPSPYKLQAYNDSSVKMSGGEIYNLYAHHNASVTMSDGTVSDLQAHNNTSVTMSDGLVSSLSAKDNASVTMSGGTVSDLLAYDNATVTMSGGSVGGVFNLNDNVVLLIEGSGFAIDGVAVDNGDITSIFGDYFGNDPHRRLTGILQNGDVIDNQFRIGDDAKIILVPEPATFFLLGLGGLALRSRRKA
jgi:hypothetical protein